MPARSSSARSRRTVSVVTPNCSATAVTDEPATLGDEARRWPAAALRDRARSPPRPGRADARFVWHSCLCLCCFTSVPLTSQDRFVTLVTAGPRRPPASSPSERSPMSTHHHRHRLPPVGHRPGRAHRHPRRARRRPRPRRSGRPAPCSCPAEDAAPTCPRPSGRPSGRGSSRRPRRWPGGWRSGPRPRPGSAPRCSPPPPGWPATAACCRRSSSGSTPARRPPSPPSQAAQQFVDMFTALGGLMAERVTDVRDVRDRIVADLTGQGEPGVPSPAVPVGAARRRPGAGRHRRARPGAGDRPGHPARRHDQPHRDHRPPARAALRRRRRRARRRARAG